MNIERKKDLYHIQIGISRENKYGFKWKYLVFSSYLRENEIFSGK